MGEGQSAVDGVWESPARAAALARLALAPASWGYGAVVALRNAAYDAGWLRSYPLALPAISVGNLTVGGTGKTPVSAFIAARLVERGARPAIVMRGYGGDESLVHAKLNPGVPVIVAADRVLGAAHARAAGSTVAVLDDAFQHRRARRDADIVLLAADFGWGAALPRVRLLPAGPWREPLGALRRASLIVVTRKRASRERAEEWLAHARTHAPESGGAVVRLAADRLISWSSGESVDAALVRGQSVLAIAAIGDPLAFSGQLEDIGAGVAVVAARDHHAYSAAEAVDLARRGAASDRIVCTLKDAVKLGPLWPREAPPLWYLSQRVVVESGADALDRILTAVAGPKSS
jgi:tetraacyldisaccharide 4'-kinase